MIIELLDGSETIDSSLLAEAWANLAWFNKALEQYEVNRLLSGPYDKRGARITITAGAGGTDAQVREVTCVDDSIWESLSEGSVTVGDLLLLFATPTSAPRSLSTGNLPQRRAFSWWQDPRPETGICGGLIHWLRNLPNRLPHRDPFPIFRQPFLGAATFCWGGHYSRKRSFPSERAICFGASLD